MSYGLCQTWEWRNFGLREKRTYPNWMYYLLLAYDIPARFTYVLALVLDPNVYPFIGNKLFYSTVLFYIDILRRQCWFILRLESEQVLDMENFR